MAVITGVLCMVVIISAIEVPSMLRNKMRKELWIFSIILLTGTVLSIAQSLHIHLPNPADWIIYMYKPISDVFFRWLQ